MSEYIPRSINGLPMLTIFTLTNFFFVFLSCISTVFVLRMYHPAATMSHNINRLPRILRLLLFEYLARALCFKLHVNEENNDNLNRNHELRMLKKSTQLHQKSKKIASNSSIQHENDDPNEEFAKKLLDMLKQLNRLMHKAYAEKENKENHITVEKTRFDNKKGSHSSSSSSSSTSQTPQLTLKSDELLSNSNNNSFNRHLFKEEWKQAALILDRLFFYLFLIMMPLTITVFFRVNVVEYIISSNIKRNDDVPNINGC